MSDVRNQALVKVYGYSLFSEAEQDNLISRYKAAIETILTLGGDVLEDTEEEVPEEALDKDGMYDPEPSEG